MVLLPLKTQSAPGVSLYAPAGSGGGGGGGVGPDPAFSSITIQTGVMTTNSNQGFTFQNTTTPVIQDAYLGGQSNLPMATGPGVANIFLLNSAAGSNNSLTLGAGNDNAGYIWSSAPGTQDGTQPLYIRSAGVNISSLTVSSINGATPGGGGSVPMDLAVSTLTLNSQPTAAGGTLTVNSIDPDLYNFSVISSNATPVANFALGTIGGRNQLYATVGEIDQCFTSSITAVGGGPVSVTSATTFNNILNAGVSPVNISSLTVSSINGAAPGGFSPINKIVPFVTGSSASPLWNVTVPQNTAGAPIPLTSTLITNPTHTYHVSFSMVNGTNNDLTSITRLKLYTAGTDLPVRAYPGDAADFTSGGMASAVSVLVSGANALRLQAENSSTTTPTVLNFDEANSVRITDLGAS